VRRDLPPALILSPLLALWLGVGLWRGAGARMVGDESPFLTYAHNLLHGLYATPGSTDATQFLWHGPGLPALLAPLVALGAPLAVLRLTGPLLLFVAILLFHRLLRMSLPPRWALAGAWALGLYAPFGEVVGPLHKEPLALVLLIAALLGVAGYLRDGRRGQLALAGLGLAALAMTRLEYGWVVIGLLAAAGVWLALTRAVVARRAFAICALALAGCVPWLAYTHALTGRVLYWGNAGGLSLYWMAPHPRQLGSWHAVHTVFRDPTLTGYRPFFAHLRTLAPLPRDLVLQHAALGDIAAHPAAYVLNLGANAGRMLFAAPFSIELAPRLVGSYALFTLLLLGALGWAFVRAWSHRMQLPRATRPFAAFALAGFVVHLAPSAEPRLVMPLVPIVLWLTLHAAATARAARPSRLQRASPGGQPYDEASASPGVGLDVAAGGASEAAGEREPEAGRARDRII
jgi:hypothetical protein